MIYLLEWLNEKDCTRLNGSIQYNPVLLKNSCPLRPQNITLFGKKEREEEGKEKKGNRQQTSDQIQVGLHDPLVQLSSVTQSCPMLCYPMDCSTWAGQAFLSVTNSWSLLKLMSIKLVMPSNHLILCCPLLLPSIFPRSRVFIMSQFFASGGQSIGASASASVLPINT